MRLLINLDHLTFKEGGGGRVEELVCAIIFFSHAPVFSVYCLKGFAAFFPINLPHSPPQKLNGPPLIVVFLFCQKNTNIWAFS